MNSFKLFFAAIALSGTCGITPALADEPQMNTNSNSREEKVLIEEQTEEAIIDLIEIQGQLLEETELIESERIFEAVEQLAQFPGGNSALHSWIGKNLIYPEVAQENNIVGRVIVQFVVEKDGSITHPVIARGVDKDLDKEAIRLVKAMPKWSPGRNNGEAVRSRFTLPITFRLQNY